MQYKNITLSILITGLIILGIIIGKTTHKTNQNSVVKIGILQTASHPALDAARNGFIDAIHNKLGSNVEFTTHNAQGSIVNAHTIAEHFHADDSIKGIYAIATPALQAIASIEKNKPIFIAAVTNPHELNIINEKTNICGTTDMIDISGTIKAIKNILPHVVTIALLYNPSEANSVAQVKIMDKELQKNFITPIYIGIATEVEIPQAVASALSKADALLTPTDNLIASAMPIISHLARTAQKPLIACHNQAVEQGAFMARGVDYYESGKETGNIAVEILHNGKQPFNVPIRPTKSDTIVINKQVLNELNITIGEISDTIMYINSNT